MTKRRIFSITLLAVMLCGILLIASSCFDNKDKKHDVSIKIFYREAGSYSSIDYINRLGEWIFTPDENEMFIDFEYDGMQYEFLAEVETISYIRPADQWKGLTGEMHISLSKEGEPNEYIREYLCEKGKYTLLIHIDCPKHSHNLWNSRTIKLHINVI